MTSRIILARTALRRAFDLRADLRIEQHLPVCPIDAADRRAVEVWFSNAGSMEGLYVRDDPARILIPADRPFGRQVFACAHELGHHEMGHGTRLHEYLADDGVGPAVADEEYAAHVFAAAFLMPRAAVDHAFQVRGWRVLDATAAQVYLVACNLGVSYDGLLTHLSQALRVLPRGRAVDLAKTSLPTLRREILGADFGERLVVADEHWEGKAVDLAVREGALLPKGAVADGSAVSWVRSLDSGELFLGTRPGISRIVHPGGWSVFVRVRRERFIGLGSIRHQDDPDVE